MNDGGWSAVWDTGAGSEACLAMIPIGHALILAAWGFASSA